MIVASGDNLIIYAVKLDIPVRYIWDVVLCCSTVSHLLTGI